MAKRDDFQNSEPVSTDFGLIVRLVTPTTPIPVTPGAGSATTSVVTYTAATGASQTLFSANTAVKGRTIYVDHATNYALVKFGATAASNSFTVKILAGGYYEVPFGYTGRIDAIMSAASGNFALTEVTA